MFNNKTILITGGTGSFGKKFSKIALSKFKKIKIIIFSRDEMKQWEMDKEFNSNNLKFIIGDIRDLESLNKAMKGVDYVIHVSGRGAALLVSSCFFYFFKQGDSSRVPGSF